MKYSYLEHTNITSANKSALFDSILFQASNGKLHSQRHVFSHQDLSIVIRHETVATAAIYRNDSQHFFIGLPSTDIIVNGNTIEQSRILALAPDESFFSPLPENFVGIGLSFSVESARKHLSDASYKVLKSGAVLIRNGSIALDDIEQYSKEIRGLCDLLQSECDSPQRTPAAFYIDKIFIMLDQMLSPHLTTIKNQSSLLCKRKNIVSRAVDYLLAHPQQQVTVIQLAACCFCSVRSLEYAFKSIFQMTPKQFLTFRLLHSVKEQLEQNAESCHKDIFQRFDISNYSRFTNQYTEFFGETPKETRLNNTL